MQSQGTTFRSRAVKSTPCRKQTPPRSTSLADSPYLASSILHTKSSHAAVKSIYSCSNGPSRSPTAPTPKWKMARKPPPSAEVTKWNRPKEHSGKADRPTSVPADIGLGCKKHLAAKHPKIKQAVNESNPLEETSIKPAGLVERQERPPRAWDLAGLDGMENSASDPDGNRTGIAGYSVDVAEASENQVGYGMTLSEYISNMRTTPAASSSFADLRNEQWASIPLQSLSSQGVNTETNAKKQLADFGSDTSDQSATVDENLSPPPMSAV